MSILQEDQVDVIGIDPLSEEVVLTVADHLDWRAPGEHMLALQKKLNRYLAFVESGELLATYPEAAGRKVGFEIVVKFPLPPSGVEFIEKIRPIVADAGIALRVRRIDDISAARPS